VFTGVTLTGSGELKTMWKEEMYDTEIGIINVYGASELSLDKKQAFANNLNLPITRTLQIT
jgi:hypothetical protein